MKFKIMVTAEQEYKGERYADSYTFTDTEIECSTVLKDANGAYAWAKDVLSARIKKHLDKIDNPATPEQKEK